MLTACTSIASICYCHFGALFRRSRREFFLFANRNCSTPYFVFIKHSLQQLYYILQICPKKSNLLYISKIVSFFMMRYPSKRVLRYLLTVLFYYLWIKQNVLNCKKYCMFDVSNNTIFICIHDYHTK